MTRWRAPGKQQKTATRYWLVNCLRQYCGSSRRTRFARKALKRLQSHRIGKPASQAEIDALVGLYSAGDASKTAHECQKLLRRDPTSVLALNILGSALQALGKIAQATGAFDRAIQLHPGFAEAYNNRGNAFKEIGRVDDAVANYDKAVAAKPDYAEAWFNRGNALRDAGRFDDAVTSYEHAIEIAPGFAQALRCLGDLKSWQTNDPLLASLEELHQSLADADPARAEICFALANAKEKLGDPDSSFRYLSEGNQLRKQALDYSLADDRALFEQIRSLSWSDVPATRISSAINGEFRPVFIVGMMRSGTSLVEQILASHGDVHGAGELETLNRLVMPLIDAGNALSTRQIDALRAGYVDYLGELQPRAAVVTDKMPLNFRWVGFILNAFPEASIVHVQRDSVATCWSIYKHYFPAEGHGYAWDLGDIAEFFELYRSYMAYWHERFPGRIYNIGYEALTEQQETETRKLLDYCELGWDPACMEFHRARRTVATSSVTQVREPMYQGSSSAWRRYETLLQGTDEGRAFLERLTVPD